MSNNNFLADLEICIKQYTASHPTMARQDIINYFSTASTEDLLLALPGIQTLWPLINGWEYEDPVIIAEAPPTTPT